MEYLFDGSILPDNEPSMVPDVAISPNGLLFAASCQNANRVHLYNFTTRECIRSWSNPNAGLDHPHAIAMTDRFVLVGNKMDPEDRPALLQVFDTEDPSGVPVCNLATPLPYLREAHSMSLLGNRLLVTYAGTGKSALACYAFDEQSGQIGEMLDIAEGWFDSFGTAKGVCFYAEGDRALVSFVSVKRISSTLGQKFGRARWLLRQKQGLRRLLGTIGSKLSQLITSGKMSAGEDETSDNGVAVFTVASDGAVSREPVAVQLESGYARLENVHIVANKCAIADPVRGQVALYEIDESGLPDKQTQVIREQLSFPHNACIAPDGRSLLVSNCGLRIENEKPQWHEYTDLRTDNICVFRVN